MKYFKLFISMKCYNCNKKMRKLVDFTLEPIHYCIECDVLTKDKVTHVKR